MRAAYATRALKAVLLVTILVATTAVLPTTPSTAASAIPIGIATGDTLPGFSADALNAQLDDDVALGITSIRLDLAWDDIQPDSATTYAWANFDRIVQAANARGMSLLPTLAYTPAWARPTGCSSDKCPPAQVNQFAAFVTAAVQRYAPLGIHMWEIWNEPNLTGFWQPAPDPVAYTALLRAAHNAIKTIDPSATVMLGGLASTLTVNGDIAQDQFLNQVCGQGGLAYADAVAYHPYTYPVPPGYDASWSAWNKISTLSTVLAACGVPNLKIWITEYGAPTNGPGASATLSDYKLGQSTDHVDEALQAEMATESVELARTNPAIGGLYWYSHKDLGTDTSTSGNFYGLRRYDGSQKPAWTALRNAIASGTGPSTLSTRSAPFPDGYRITTSDGITTPFGGAAIYGSSAPAPIVDMTAMPDQLGYWLLGQDGGVFPYGNASSYGSTSGMHLNAPVIGMASTADGNGYWVMSGDGGVFSFGDASFHGSTGGMRLNKPIVGMAATPDGGGYWLVAADGGVFTFGDAGFFGSTGAIHLNQPIVGMAATPDGGGYWLVAADGGVFAFGDGPFSGSLASSGQAPRAIAIAP